MIEIRGLRVEYGRTPAVRGLDLDVHRGEIVALVGPNGAGKTSTVSAVFGLAPVRGGSIRFEGQSLVGLPVEQIVRRGLALVPEGRHIFHRLTVAENLALGVLQRRRGAEMIDRGLDRFPALLRYLKSPAGLLSGGEQQQLAIARAMASGPKLMLLDEPSLGLAPLIVNEVFAALLALRDEGTSILLVEQNAKRAIELADRSYVLRNGELAATGGREEMAAGVDVHSVYLGDADGLRKP